MISKKMTEQLNEQIKNEVYSAAYYFAISSYCSAKDYHGTAHYFRVQAGEEMNHALKIYDYLLDVDARAVVPAVEQPPVEYTTIEEIFKKALAHEQFITSCINKLMDLANGEKDYATANFLQWFVKEQIEEEANVNKVLAQLKMVGTDSRGLFLLDMELGKRG